MSAFDSAAFDSGAFDASVTGSFTINGIVRVVGSGTFTLDEIVKSSRSSTLTIDEIVRTSGSGTFTADEWVRTVGTGSFTIDLWVPGGTSSEFTIDSIVRAVGTGSLTVDEWIRASRSDVLTVDEIVRASRTGSFTLNEYVSTPPHTFLINMWVSVVNTTVLDDRNRHDRIDTHTGMTLASDIALTDSYPGGPTNLFELLQLMWGQVSRFESVAISTQTFLLDMFVKGRIYGSFGIYSYVAGMIHTAQLYVAVGFQGKLATSPDGINWTQRTSGFSTSITISSVAYVMDIFVVGAATASTGASPKVSYSSDGTAWTAATWSSTGIPVGFASDGNIIVAVTDDAEIYTSGDSAVTWTHRTSGLTEGTDILKAVAYSPSLALFVAVGTVIPTTGTSGRILTSPDGITWTSQTVPSSWKQINDVAWAADIGQFVIVHEDLSTAGTVKKIATSTDGTSWTKQSSPWDSVASRPIAAFRGDDGLWFVVGTSTQRATKSSDGVTWSSVTTGSTQSTITDVVRGDRWVIAEGGGGNVRVSTDTTNWAAYSFGASVGINGLAVRHAVHMGLLSIDSIVKANRSASFTLNEIVKRNLSSTFSLDEWVGTPPSYWDGFDRTTTPDDPGGVWVNDGTGGNTAFYCNGTQLSMGPDTSPPDANTSAFMHAPGPGPWGDATTDFDMQIQFRVTEWQGDGSGFYTEVGTDGMVGAYIQRDAAGSSGWLVGVWGPFTFMDGVELGDLDTSADYQFRWQHHPVSDGVSRVRIWKTADTEPGTWHASRDATGDITAANDSLRVDFYNLAVLWEYIDFT